MKFIALFIASAAWMAAADPGGFGQWKGAELKEAAKKLAPRSMPTRLLQKPWPATEITRSA